MDFGRKLTFVFVFCSSWLKIDPVYDNHSRSLKALMLEDREFALDCLDSMVVVCRLVDIDLSRKAASVMSNRLFGSHQYHFGWVLKR